MHVNAAAPPPTPLPLALTEKNSHDIALRTVEGGAYEIKTTGSDPYLFTEPFPEPRDLPDSFVLAFDYFSTTGTDHVQVFVDPPIDEEHSIKAAGLSRSEGWSPYAADLNPLLFRVKGKVRTLRLDFGTAAGKTFQIRNLRLRPPSRQEIALAARRVELQKAELRLETRLRGYLNQHYPCQVTRVEVNDQQIKITGKITGPSDALRVAEVPMAANVTELSQFPTLLPIQADARGQFTTAVPRQDKAGKDRLLSRWAVVRKVGSRYELRSQARYPDALRPQADLPEARIRNKKGLGGFGVDRPLSDIEDLDISAVTVNIVINSLFSTTSGEGRTPFPYGGKEWYANDAQIAGLDRTLEEAAKRRVVVSAIVLVGQGAESPDGSFSHLLAHPDADPAGIFAMPNVSSDAGALAYAAAMDFLAKRYSRPDSKYGRIHHWIMHNEINAGWIWTNAGDKSALRYMDLYHRSMRTVYLIARQYDPHAKVFISLEHHWNMAPGAHFYKGKELLEMLATFSRTEGDFDWAIAFHPYPQNLFDPQVWKDNQVNFTFDTPKITFKNLEVLDAFVKKTSMRFEGKSIRAVHLSEQGLNSRDYTDAQLRDQAAGMAFAWNKYKNLESIEVFHYHNWVDNRHEGGLRIGLRKFPDDKDDPLGKKPIWYVYKAMGTAREDEVLAPYKAVIGVGSWAEVLHSARVTSAK
ncbi:MAG: DUF5722 domain-containing protein [Armatimonadota bacterium]